MSDMITGAQAVVDCLRRERVEHVFGIPGTMNLPILDVLRDTPEIRFILTRHEQGAAFMAYGYARALNRPAIVTATEGPGVTNLATGIGAAYKGYVPVISISGAQEIWLREKDASQDIDQVAFHRPITKWAYSIPAASKIQESIRRRVIVVFVVYLLILLFAGWFLQTNYPEPARLYFSFVLTATSYLVLVLAHDQCVLAGQVPLEHQVLRACIIGVYDHIWFM